MFFDFFKWVWNSGFNGFYFHFISCIWTRQSGAGRQLSLSVCAVTFKITSCCLLKSFCDFSAMKYICNLSDTFQKISGRFRHSSHLWKCESITWVSWGFFMQQNTAHKMKRSRCSYCKSQIWTGLFFFCGAI
jgi:hypothetical protein